MSDAQGSSLGRPSVFKEFPCWLTFIGMLALAGGIFVSAGVCAIYHVCLIVAALFMWRSFRWNELPTSAKCLLIFVLTGVLSTAVNAASMDSPSRLLKMKYPLLGVLGVFLLGIAFKRFITLSKIRVLANLFLLSITLASLYGIVKTWGQFDLLTFSTGEFDSRSGGFTGIMRYSHGIQMVLVILSAILVYQKQAPEFFHRGLLLVAYIASLIGLWASGTRGAIVGFLCAVPFVFFFCSRRRFWLSSAVCWPLAILIIFGNFLKTDAPTVPSAPNAVVLRGMSGDDRLSLYSAALYALKERPLLGYGPVQFKNQIIRLRSEYDLDWKGRPAPHAHNTFLETAANLGGVGLAALLAWLFFWARELWVRKDLMAKCILPFICAFIVSGQFEYTFDANNAFLVFFVYSLSSIPIHRASEDTFAIHKSDQESASPQVG